MLSETNLGDVLEAVNTEQPDVLIVDSIQTLYNDALDAAAGSVSQVKDCTLSLMQVAKGQGITVFVIGHVNKEGSIAGPKVLEHMVDCVLYFEGDQHTGFCGRRRTASALPTRSVFLKCGTRGWRRWRTRRKCCSPADRRTPPAPVSPV